MKTKISHLGRSTVSVILAVMMLLSTMLIGTVSTVNAIGMSNGACIYFDNSKTNWKDKYINFVIGKDINNDNYSSVYVMSRVGNTDLYYCQMPDWSGATYVAVCGTTAKWDSGTWSSTNLTNATHYTATYTDNFNFESNKSYLLQTSSSTNNTALTPSYFDSSNGSLNVEVKVDNSTPSSSIADISVNSYKFGSSKDSVESTSATISSDSVASTNLETAYSAITTLKCNNIKDGYKFVGWYVDNSLLSSNKSYTYNPYYSISSNKFGSISVEARFEQDMSSVAGSVTLTASPETVTSGGSTKLTATLTDKATGVDKVTYTFKKDDGTVVGTVTDSAENTASVDVANITSDTKYTVTVSADNYTSVTNTVTVTATSDSSDKYAIHVKLADNLESYTLWLWAWEKGGSNAYGDAVTWKSDDVKVSLNDHEWHNFPFKNPVKNWNLIIAYDKGQTAFENGYNSDVWITVNGDGNYDVSTIAPTKYTVTYGVNGGNGTLTATGVSGSGSTVNSGTKVTFTATPNKDYSVEGWYSDAGCTNKIESTGTNKTYTVTVNADTNVYVKFREANKYTVKFNSNDPTFGTVSATNGTTSLNSDTKVTEGDEVTFTAEPKSGYALSSWTVNGAPVSPTTNPYKITVNSNTTVVANFEKVTVTPSGYYLLCGTDPTFQEGSYKYVTLYKNGENAYYADFEAADIPKDKEYYIIFSDKNDTSGIINDSSDNIKITKVSVKGFSLDNYNANVQQPAGGSYGVKFAKVYINGDSDVVSFTIKVNNLDLNSKKITYSAEPKFKEPVKNAVNIIAKNGTQTAKFQSMGTTVITPVDKVVFGIGSYNDYTQKATAIKGNKVTVTTTVADDYKNTYYVKGFVVNGESYGIQSEPNDEGVYTLEYQIPDDVDDGTNFEITPVYFLKDSRNCVTFYVEGFDGAVQDSWGNTIACYPYYKGVDKDNTNNNAFGAYPGQPLLYEGGKYYTQIPKSITLDGTTRKIVGMTLNNFALESVHGAISTIKENKQSYDYDDFVRIANNDYGNNIIYTFKYSTVKDNFGELTESPAIITKADFDSPKGNGWEDLTDYNHRKVDLFGDVLTDTASNNEPLLVVSNGYFENYQGYYATEWTVYKKLDDGTYSKIAQIPSSALLLKSKDDLTNSTSDTKYENPLSSYANAYAELEAYKNTPAKITFESSIKKGYSLQGHTNGGQGGELADRVDGRWYYSMIGEEITAKIAVEYGDTATSDFTNDPFEGDTNKTTTIGAQAYFTNDAASGQTTYKSRIDSSKYFTFTADTIATDKDGQNYVFLGWYLLSDDKYTKLTDAKAPMTGSDTFVARYVKAPKGTVTIDHRLFSAASNPTPTQNVGTGSGKCYVTVRVLDKDDTVIKKFDETEGSVTLDGTYIDSTKDYKLEITLRTVTSGQDKFQQFYYLKQDKKSYVPIDSSTTTTTGNETKVTRMVDIRKNFFKLNDDGTYSFKNETGSDSIHYYSDIKETKIPYKITFKYEPRLESDAKQYVVKGEFTSEYILKYGAELTENFVMSVAPYEDNFFNTIKWDNAKIDIDNSGTTKTAVIESTTSSRTVTVKALDAEGNPIKAYELNGPEFVSTVFYGKLLTYNNLCGLTPEEKTEIANDREYIYVADPEYNGKKFSYWQISTSSVMNDTSAYVTKCFSKEFNYIAYNHYYIWPVYGESQSITGASTTLNFLDYSRNQSTGLEGENKTDRVFADFALAFDSNGIQLQTYKGTNIKVGMFLEVCGDLESDSTGKVITDIDYYKNMPGYSTSETDLDSIKSAILAGSSSTKSLTYTTEAGKERKLLNKPIDINSLDNKNRIEYYVGYNNNPNNQKKLMRAYSYVIVDNEITLCSTPYSFVNYYDVGNKTYTVS